MEQPSESDDEESVRLPLKLIETNLDGFPPEVISGKTIISHQTKEEEKQPFQKAAQKSRVAMQKQGGLLKIDVTAANLAEPNVVMPPQGGLSPSPGKVRIKL